MTEARTESVAVASPGRLTTFVGQLRQRNVFKVAAAYAITGWLLIEVVNNVFPVFNFPQWTSQFAILLVLLGFPIALVFAWIFELTPEGIKTTATANTPPGVQQLQSQKFNFVILGLVVLATGFLLVDRFVLDGGNRAEDVSAQATPVTGVQRMSLVLPRNRLLVIGGWPSRDIAISPDGSKIVYRAENRDLPVDRPRTQLQVRELNSLTVTDLPDTLDPFVHTPFFSPDGQWVAFLTADNILKKVDLAGGNAITLATAVGSVTHGVWTTDGKIIFNVISLDVGLSQVSAEGGQPTTLTSVDAANGENYHILPVLLPSPAHVLFTVINEPPRPPHVEVVDLDTGARQPLLDNAIALQVLDSGHLLFQRDGDILLMPFDAAALTLTGTAVAVTEDIAFDSPANTQPYAEVVVAANGTLAYLPAVGPTGELGILEPGAGFESLGLPADYYSQPRVAPDGRSLAVVIAGNMKSAVYRYDLERGTLARLSQDDAYIRNAEWRPDGGALAIAPRGGGIAVLENGIKRLVVPEPAGPAAVFDVKWSADGSQLFYLWQEGATLRDIRVSSSDGSQDTPAVAGPAEDVNPAPSPDGRWLAYVTDESGRYEVYVQAYPGGAAQIVSTEGGFGPRWSASGDALYYVGTHDNTLKMLRVTVGADANELRLGQPEPLFDMDQPSVTGLRYSFARPGNASGPSYDILPDGRFVLVRNSIEDRREVVVVLNWFDEVRRLAPTAAMQPQ